MRNDWILDVLADLQSFARKNGMDALAEQLGDTKIIAAAEVMSLDEKAYARCNEQNSSGADTGNTGASRRA
ncbi:hypothetical protein SuNHUV7_18700 (plasmid) [Pseudoseohaeicola sp. NH-UV-7]|jgi:hypothetical protein|uniref:hypothetical protein n=1 Tax=unclassified Sulfitobacter TaxID=196795 RepID=UPI0013B39D90|nr:hypothetical protein [Sulfitobacter sp. JL08]